MRSKKNTIIFAYTLAVLSTSWGCGSRRQESTNSVTRTVIEQAFIDSAAANGVPVRVMMAAGYVESGLRAERSSSSYSFDGLTVPVTLIKGESVFGFSLTELGISVTDSVELQAQIQAYGRLLKAQLSDGPSIGGFVTAEEKMRWIWKIASIHMGKNASRNLLAVFAREIMTTLNQGFSVQNSEGIVARLEAESRALSDADFPENIKQDLTLDMYHADIRSAYLFSLMRENPSKVENVPTHIEVVHCPFTLSTCIQMQGSKLDEANPLTAHYIVPASDGSVPGVLQFFHQDESVALLDVDGKAEIVKDRVVIMLVGSSGRYSEGHRKFANPMWMTDYQLRLLGAAISDICGVIAHGDSALRQACQTVGGTGGIVFRTQPAETYRWGDIPDYDETIITPYLTGSDGILATTTLTLNPDSPVVAGHSFKLTASFQAAARRVELERLVRCPSPDDRVVWEPIEQRQIRNETSHSFDGAWFDSGPNGTGDQFFRIKVNGAAGKFLGWSTKLVQMRNFDKTDVAEVPSKYCLRNGT